jgi:hypothetical protein
LALTRPKSRRNAGQRSGAERKGELKQVAGATFCESDIVRIEDDYRIVTAVRGTHAAVAEPLDRRGQPSTAQRPRLAFDTLPQYLVRLIRGEQE